MVNGLRSLARFGINRTTNLKDYLRGNPLTKIFLSSMTLDQDDIRLAKRWLRNRWQWTDSSIVSKYEAEFARWIGSKYAVAFMGGRVALSACIYALGLKPGDEVILPGYTCVVVPNAFHYAGVKTIYSDIELDTFGLDAGQIQKKITTKTRAIILHHLYGLVSRDYDPILDVAKRYSLFVIEDCAQSTGAEYNGRKTGNFGEVSFYSSEQSKVFNTIQGGMAVTNEDKFAQRLREYYDLAPYPEEDWVEKQLYNVILNYYEFKHPQRWWLGDFMNMLYGDKRLISTTSEEERGICPAHYGRKMPPPIAALGLNQLKKIDSYNEQRRQTAKRWDRWCEEKGYKRPFITPHSVPVYLRYPVLVEPEKKRDISWAEKELGIELGVWFVSNLHPVSCRMEGFPNADKAVKQCINFPCLVE
jgi:perosamine synthetase